ncbi:WRKY transcription factor 90 [Tripterygium wilfordii]|uniref:WRKY transcription factor 90 n=1 Tax=Tripterygium wilfordii TaxID=458696 RepID=A0A7J7CCF2_TRIWF|nr:probable WRKY transcription factor 30 [Tripterygium wilfordii]KAF5731782.1 WRKY transcription factor 90 [Tripterygium wilfordii]
MEDAIITLRKQKSEIISELWHGKEVTEQLIRTYDHHLHESETHQFLASKILSSFEKTLAMLSGGFMVGYPTQPTTTSLLDQDCMEQCSKKRKSSSLRWSEQVWVCPGRVERPPVAVDGHSWRKYGQKQILGSKFPRGYYRCTHRDSQGCLATKQLQQSDNDPAIFLVNYRGTHTCSHLEPIMISVEEPRDRKSDHHQQQEEIERGKVFEEIDYYKLLKNTGEDLEDIFPSFNFLESDYVTVSRMNNLEGGQSFQSDLNQIISTPADFVTNPSIGDLDFSNIDAYFCK